MDWDPSDVIALVSLVGGLGVSSWSTLSARRQAREQLLATQEHERIRQRIDKTWDAQVAMLRAVDVLAWDFAKLAACEVPQEGINETLRISRAMTGPLLTEINLWASEDFREAWHGVTTSLSKVVGIWSEAEDIRISESGLQSAQDLMQEEDFLAFRRDLESAQRRVWGLMRDALMPETETAHSLRRLLAAIRSEIIT